MTETGHAYAANLDGLAGVPGADTQTYDLGVTLGVNAVASYASGTLAMLPSSPPPNNADRFPDFREFWDGVPSVGQVFDPHSKAVKPARESAGISGIAVGITSRATETNPGGQITARTPDGHSASLPIAPGTTFFLRTGDRRLLQRETQRLGGRARRRFLPVGSERPWRHTRHSERRASRRWGITIRQDLRHHGREMMGKHPRNALTFMPPAGATPHTFFIALCAIAVTLTLSLSACTPRSSHPTHESLAITSRTLKNIDELDTPSTPTNGGTHVSTALKNNILTVASINSTEHTPQWALDISLTNASDSRISWPDYPDHDLAGRLMSTAVGALVVSPNGNYVSLALQVTRKQEDEPQLTDQSSTVEPASQQRGYVVVLDARTGRTILSRELSGFILAQALTNDHLAVETAHAYFPAGEGKGTITAFPLDGTSSPTSTPTDQWLMGAGQDSLLLSPQPVHHKMCSDPCGPFTLTRISISGQKLGTITHADRVYRGGWVERYKEPAPDGGDGEASAQAAREVVDVDTGAATDLNGDQAEETGLSTDPGLLVTRRTDPDKQSSPSVPVAWLSADDDGHPHTENLEQFTSK